MEAMGPALPSSGSPQLTGREESRDLGGLCQEPRVSSGHSQGSSKIAHRLGFSQVCIGAFGDRRGSMTFIDAQRFRIQKVFFCLFVCF